MARINLLSWNIEVYGPKKHSWGTNSYALICFIGQVITQQDANVVVLMELMNSVAGQICKSLTENLYVRTNSKWLYATHEAKTGDKEAYGILWRDKQGFGIINDAKGQPYIRLSEQQFPDNWALLNGRRAVMAGFRTLDTGVTFTVSGYHAPPPKDANSTYAWAGIEALAKSADLYHLDVAGQLGVVQGRMLAGDFNLDVNRDSSFRWLTDPLPAVPPPSRQGTGAGTEPITTSKTHLISMEEVKRRWGPNIKDWGVDTSYYVELPIDNIFYGSPVSPPGGTGGVIKLMDYVMAPDQPLRHLAQQFKIYDFINPAFPNSNLLPTPLSDTLSDPRVAWLLLRYAVSDHLPVAAAINI
jgi:hypothetical protein